MTIIGTIIVVPTIVMISRSTIISNTNKVLSVGWHLEEAPKAKITNYTRKEVEDYNVGFPS